jgi:hypothetical protein
VNQPPAARQPTIQSTPRPVNPDRPPEAQREQFRQQPQVQRPAPEAPRQERVVRQTEKPAAKEDAKTEKEKEKERKR